MKMDSNHPKHVETKGNLHQLLKCKQLYSALYGVYTDVPNDLTTVLKKSAAKGETSKTTVTESPSNKDFRGQRRRKHKPTDDANKRVKKPP
jgi:hypothetical protein